MRKIFLLLGLGGLLLAGVRAQASSYLKCVENSSRVIDVFDIKDSFTAIENPHVSFTPPVLILNDAQSKEKKGSFIVNDKVAQNQKAYTMDLSKLSVPIKSAAVARGGKQDVFDFCVQLDDAIFAKPQDCIPMTLIQQDQTPPFKNIFYNSKLEANRAKLPKITALVDPENQHIKKMFRDNIADEYTSTVASTMEYMLNDLPNSKMMELGQQTLKTVNACEKLVTDQEEPLAKTIKKLREYHSDIVQRIPKKPQNNVGSPAMPGR